jgi:hypothetical protein
MFHGFVGIVHQEEILFDAQWADPVELPGITRPGPLGISSQRYLRYQ